MKCPEGRCARVSVVKHWTTRLLRLGWTVMSRSTVVSEPCEALSSSRETSILPGLDPGWLEHHLIFAGALLTMCGIYDRQPSVSWYVSGAVSRPFHVGILPLFLHLPHRNRISQPKAGVVFSCAGKRSRRITIPAPRLGGQSSRGRLDACAAPRLGARWTGEKARQGDRRGS